MKIIKQGILPQHIEYVYSCINCQTRFVFTKSEVVYRTDCRNEEWYECACPHCKQTVHIYRLVPYIKDDNPYKH